MDLNARLVDAHVWRQQFVFSQFVWPCKGCWLACVCVFACFLGNQQFVFASVAFFSADNKKSGNGSFSATATPSGELITTNNCHSEQPGLHLKKKKNLIVLSLYLFFWWPILARLAVEAQMQYCDKEPVSKNTWNEKKKKIPPHPLP